jgi:hypothetical protein
MKQSDSLTKLAPALVTAHSALKAITKDATNPHFKNRYASLDAIMEAVRPVLVQNGLAIIQGGAAPVSNVDGQVTGVAVETMLVHSSGEYITSAITLPIDKPTPQAVGGAITYGRRYGVAALLALTTEEDDDGNAASTPRAAAPAQGVNFGALTSKTHPTATARPTNGDRGSHAKLMPFGKKKGTALGEIDTKDLASTVDWCRATDAEKFKDLIAACEDVLNDRIEEESQPSLAGASGYDDPPF